MSCVHFLLGASVSLSVQTGYIQHESMDEKAKAAPRAQSCGVKILG